VLGAVVVAVAVLVAAVALTSRQNTPPTIAEFAPQAVAQIKQTLDEQSAEDPARTGNGTAGGESPPPSAAASGTGPDGSPAAAAGATTSAPPPVDVPRVRQCVGTPPRQTEDPQSPPCVPYFDPDIDNGGATSKGVTGDQITIALPQQFLEDLGPPKRLEQYFNKRYEFYGRKLLLQDFRTAGCVDSQPDPAKMREDAVLVDEDLQVFASLAYAGCQGADYHYYDALAERKVLSIVDGNLVTGLERNYVKRSPYQWNVMAGLDVILSSTAEFYCKGLAGRPPRHAGNQISSRPERKLGVITTRSTDGSTPDLTPLRNGLRACGVTPVEKVDAQTTGRTRPGVETIVQLQDAGVTSVMCLCNPVDLREIYMPTASSQGYQPEWVETSYINNDLDNTYAGGNAPPDQSSHVIGISFRNKLLPRQFMPWYNAVREADDTYEPSAGVYYSANSRYQQLLLLASGIQLAGPRLTPETFRAGLQKARWANPGAGREPFFQARVGFEGPRHTMSADAAMFWFDPQEEGTVDPSVPGAICYVNGGRRYALGEWPRTDPAFRTGSCR
jgi:hypothetical protein